MPAAAPSVPSISVPTKKRGRSSRASGARVDPKPRHVDGLRLNGIDPNTVKPGHHYVWVSLDGQKYGVDYYEGIGYVMVRPGDGERPLVGKPGNYGGSQCFLHMGSVLMRCPPERRKQIVEEGAYGDGGSQLADQIEDEIVDRKAGSFDPFRGMGITDRHMRIRNHTRPLMDEADITDEDDELLEPRPQIP